MPGSLRLPAAAAAPGEDHRVRQALPVRRAHRGLLVRRVRAAAGHPRGHPARLAGVADPPVAGAAASQAARPVVAAW
ncbi:hypothetical protein LWP59_03270 [Amycolatopsis acidiphila]|uniref:hypothetical protein n=1 Tax=Amycolatopsis acidiphila TaxID=715473 RepID=UPI001643AFF0|nr:hypothetical protein [Amycolatopsis acidiphila]UIJ60718.1 hypothetical protein LWP59_03270 [Amycolatopsis acidiphila]GHG91247.1 hypothetical protein GCM10017788_67360 [Amycolatopsis acidiphila]